MIIPAKPEALVVTVYRRVRGLNAHPAQIGTLFLDCLKGKTTSITALGQVKMVVVCMDKIKFQDPVAMDDAL